MVAVLRADGLTDHTDRLTPCRIVELGDEGPAGVAAEIAAVGAAAAVVGVRLRQISEVGRALELRLDLRDPGERLGVLGFRGRGLTLAGTGEDEDVAGTHLLALVLVTAGVVEPAQRLIGGALGLQHRDQGVLCSESVDERLLVAGIELTEERAALGGGEVLLEHLLCGGAISIGDLDAALGGIDLGELEAELIVQERRGERGGPGGAVGTVEIGGRPVGPPVDVGEGRDLGGEVTVGQRPRTDGEGAGRDRRAGGSEERDDEPERQHGDEGGADLLHKTAHTIRGSSGVRSHPAAADR